VSSFNRLQSAIEVCGKHLKRVAKLDPEIDAVLAGHVAAVAYAVYERRIRELIAARCAHDTDMSVNRFTRVASVRLVRSIKVTELSGALGHFGDLEKDAFQKRLRASPEAVAAWDNLITGRHGVAHEFDSSPTMTLRDIERDVVRAEKVLEMFEVALGTSAEGS
jgi:hypothetical protein